MRDFELDDDQCTCDECQRRPENACYMDCGECEGCAESALDLQEIQFEIDCAIGRR